MYKKRIQLIIYSIIAIALISGMGFSECFFVVSAQTTFAETPEIFMQSRFILWDTNEKMMDSNFTISIVYLNQTNLNNNSYSIKINENEWSGLFNQSYSQNFLLENESTILNLLVIVNSVIIMDEKNIQLVDGVNKQSIGGTSEPFTINLSPLEWSKIEWNIFYAIVLGAIFSSFISYRMVKRYRKSHGTRTIN